jgi:hypothetical protein
VVILSQLNGTVTAKRKKIYMSSLTAPKSKTTTRRRGRPRSENPQNDRRATYLVQSDGRRLNAYLRQKGIDSDADLLRQLIADLLDKEGVVDPGPDSEEGKPLPAPQRKNSRAVPAAKTSDQLTLVA